MTGESTAWQPTDEEPQAALRTSILPERFEVTDGPLGWRCLACGAEVLAETDQGDAVARLSESAADHALFCGRCDD